MLHYVTQCIKPDVPHVTLHIFLHAAEEVLNVFSLQYELISSWTCVFSFSHTHPTTSSQHHPRNRPPLQAFASSGNPLPYNNKVLDQECSTIAP